MNTANRPNPSFKEHLIYDERRGQTVVMPAFHSLAYMLRYDNNFTEISGMAHIAKLLESQDKKKIKYIEKGLSSLVKEHFPLYSKKSALLDCRSRQATMSSYINNNVPEKRKDNYHLYYFNSACTRYYELNKCLSYFRNVESKANSIYDRNKNTQKYGVLPEHDAPLIIRDIEGTKEQIRSERANSVDK